MTIEFRDEQDRTIATTQTDARGRYDSTALRPGTYAVREIQPAGLLQGGQRAGSGGGNISLPDLISADRGPAGQIS